MKKIMLFLVATLTLSSVATAQKVDVEGNKKKVAAADADVQNPKKNTKAATWISRGNTYYAAATAPTKDVYRGIDEFQLNIIVGKPAETKAEVVGGYPYTVWVYPHIDLYIPEGDSQVLFWKQKTYIVNDGLDVAFESYTKAAELDPKQTSKIKGMIDKLIATCREDGEVAFIAGEYKNRKHV